jgi:hypothetical protein
MQNKNNSRIKLGKITAEINHWQEDPSIIDLVQTKNKRTYHNKKKDPIQKKETEQRQKKAKEKQKNTVQKLKLQMKAFAKQKPKVKKTSLTLVSLIYFVL